jgi:cytochrome c oxidase cbb3-type subunit 2
MASHLETPKSVALLGGVFCYVLAFTTVVLLPELLTDQSEAKVVGVDGIERDVRPYTVQEQAGRDVYGNQVCWHCHSQFVRPVNDEVSRWGPVSQTGEYAYDIPHFFGTRRIGPDLTREGLLRPDDWHYVHLFDPRAAVPHSVMPSFSWLFYEQDGAPEGRRILNLLDTDGDGIYSRKFGDLQESPTPEVEAARRKAATLDRFGVRPPPASNDTAAAMEWREGLDSQDGLLSDYDFRPLPTVDAQNVVVYLQRLGTAPGMWRRPLYVSAPPRTSPFAGTEERPRRSHDMRVYGWAANDGKRVEAAKAAKAKYDAAVADWTGRYPVLAERLERGKQLFTKHCAGCHGDDGRGNGIGAAHLMPRPRDFTVGKFKYRSTPVGNLPLDGDLYAAIWRGLPGTAMPSWRELADEQIWTLVDYVKTFYEGDKTFNDRNAVTIVQPPHVDPNPAKEIARGRAVYLASGPQCYNCHGREGRADGPAWNETTTDWGSVIRPRDFRPRIRDEWAPELWKLLSRHVERFFGKDGWAKASAAPAWKDLEPTTPEKRHAFTLFLLGERQRLVDVLGGRDAVKAILGDERFDRAFPRGADPLEDIRMAVATERDQPALRFRGGAAQTDLYRTIMNGIDGTPMKQNFDIFWKPVAAKDLAGRDDLSRRDKAFAWQMVVGTDMKLSVFTGEQRLREVGVTVKKNDQGQDEEWIKIQPGDDWALVHYVMWLSCIPVPRAGE